MTMNRLRELQRAEKLTQQELADIAEVSKRTIQNWEDGTSNIKLKKAEKLAKYFDVSVGYLLGYDDNCFEKQIREDSDFEKHIRIKTLNNFLYKIHAAYISLLEKNGGVTMTDRGFSMQGLLDENSNLKNENRRLTNELKDSYTANAKANLLDVIISKGYILKSTFDKCIGKLRETDQQEIKNNIMSERKENNQ